MTVQDVAAKAARLKWWQVALISVAATALSSLSALRPKKEQRKLYDTKLKQAPWAPPPAVFGPAWAVNNFFLVRALQRILAKDIPDKRKLLLLQAGIWLVFFTFNYVYFRKKSPILAAIWTMSDNIFAVASMLISLRSDKKNALNFLPLVLWTTFAKSLADYQALKNPDPVFHTKALMA